LEYVISDERPIAGGWKAHDIDGQPLGIFPNENDAAKANLCRLPLIPGCSNNLWFKLLSIVVLTMKQLGVASTVQGGGKRRLFITLRATPARPSPLEGGW